MRAQGTFSFDVDTADEAVTIVDGMTFPPGAEVRLDVEAQTTVTMAEWTTALEETAIADEDGNVDLKPVDPPPEPLPEPPEPEPEPPPLEAAFTFAPADPQQNDEVTFDASASTGEIDAWAWDFGDGEVGAGVTVTHAFKRGEYGVTLTVTGTDDATAATAQTVTVG